MSRRTWLKPDGKGRPAGLQDYTEIQVRYDDGEIVVGEARDFVWSWSKWDEDVIVEYCVLDAESA